MNQWDPPPPSRFQRWLARNVRVGQAAFIVIALVSAGIMVSALVSDDRSGALPFLLLTVSFAANVWSWEAVARRVRQFDAQGTTV